MTMSIATPQGDVRAHLTMPFSNQTTERWQGSRQWCANPAMISQAYKIGMEAPLT